jgi:dolichol kinase
LQSAEGSAAFVLGGAVITAGLLWFMEKFDAAGWLTQSNLTAALMASLAGSLVETFPPYSNYGNMDNVLIPVAALTVTKILNV